MSKSSQAGPMLSMGLFVAALGVIWLTNGKGIVREDHDRHISIPDRLLVPLQVRAAYNDDRIFFQYRWPADRPHLLHDVLRYEDGQWKRYGGATPGSVANGLHEDRVAMLVDDGSVPEFAKYGGYITIGSGLAEMTTQASEEDVAAHPYLGKELGEDVVSKYLPATRSDPGDWRTTVDGERMATLRRAGYFLDLWHWRANRGGPIGVADDQYVSAIRGGDDGRSAWSTNWDGENKRPRWMYDTEVTGFSALRWDDVVSGALPQNSNSFLHPGTSADFDPDLAWQEGDTLPRRAIREPAASRADIAAEGAWSDGYWNVTLSRALDTGNPLDDKIFHDGGVYAAAFAIHRNATGGRWHYVSLPVSVGLGREADLLAVRFDGTSPVWNGDWKNVTLFYPGQVTWPLLNSERHAGAQMIARGVPVKRYHSEAQLANYGVEGEFATEIKNRWRLTLAAGLLLLAALGFSMLRQLRK